MNKIFISRDLKKDNSEIENSYLHPEDFTRKLKKKCYNDEGISFLKKFI